MAFSRTHHIKGALLMTHSGQQTRQRDDECQHNKTGVRHISSLSTLICTLRKPLLRPYSDRRSCVLVSLTKGALNAASAGVRPRGMSPRAGRSRPGRASCEYWRALGEKRPPLISLVTVGLTLKCR